MLRTEDVLSMSDGWQPAVSVEGFTRRIWIDTPYSQYPEAKHVMCRVNWTGVEGADSSISAPYSREVSRVNERMNKRGMSWWS